MEQNETATPAEQPEPAPIEAQINLRDTGQGIDIEVRGASTAGPMNRAVHFANWIGANMEALVALSQGDYNHKVQQHKAARRVLSAVPRIAGPDGSPLQ